MELPSNCDDGLFGMLCLRLCSGGLVLLACCLGGCGIKGCSKTRDVSSRHFDPYGKGGSTVWLLPTLLGCRRPT